MIRAALFDLDGVLRHFDEALRAEVSARFDLPPGALVAAAFERDRLQRLVTGCSTRAAWVAEVGEAVGSPGAAQAWLQGHVGQLDRDVVLLVEELRGRGVPTGILTNGTDTIDAELEQLGVRHLFDAVVSTWDLGVAKPERGAYLGACEALGVEPAATFFVDDREENVVAAATLGMAAHRFVDAARLRGTLQDHCLLVAG
ncbi:MAG: HAD family phosphatase [Myxococcales bacterium]|nr:HAD family phosphatase [Myxococcales bacterium]